MKESMMSFISVLDSVKSELAKLTELEQQKIKVVENDDLMGLSDIMNREQALSMVFRGLEQKRTKLLSEMGLAEEPISKLIETCPPELRDEVQGAINALQSQYSEYREQADRARGTLEQSLREIEGSLAGMGAFPAERGAGYAGGDNITPPRSMTTDFRA